MIEATFAARWRVVVEKHVLHEIERVLVEKLRCTRRFGVLTRHRVSRRATVISLPASPHTVLKDPADDQVLQAALAGGCDILVTNDHHLLDQNPYQGLRIISM